MYGMKKFIYMTNYPVFNSKRKKNCNFQYFYANIKIAEKKIVNCTCFKYQQNNYYNNNS